MALKEGKGRLYGWGELRSRAVKNERCDETLYSYVYRLSQYVRLWFSFLLLNDMFFFSSKIVREACISS